jgi:hypothetical protein
MKQQTINELIGKLTKAVHLNEKLADDAVGADGTMHQCIGEELLSAIDTLKTQTQTN